MGKIKLLLQCMRPRHWVKNLFIYAGPFFSLQMFVPDNFLKLLYGFLCWCMATSAVYLLNDIIDRKEDAFHEQKKKRPIASGLVNIRLALLVCFSLAVGAVLWSMHLNTGFSLFISVYLIMNIAYSLYLKHVFILDVMCISLGFVFRVVSGALLINVGFSEWVIMCTLLLSLLLGFGKRQEELSTLEGKAPHHRRVLKEYDAHFLMNVPYVLVSSTIVCYMLYTVSSEAVRKFGTKNLIYTTPFVIYGLLRYVYIAYEKKKGADPTQVLFQDWPIVVTIVSWVLMVGLIIYMY